MPDELRQYAVGPLQTNCYAYISAGSCLIVDPGASGAALAGALSDTGVAAIVCTHGHGDHVGGVAALKEQTGAPYLIHAADEGIARHAGEVSELGIAYDDDAPEPDGFLAEGSVIEVGSASFAVVETPGHSPGSVCLVGRGSAEGIVFTGDTLFAGSRGRTDLDGGDEALIMASLTRLKREIAPASTLLPGHGPPSTMAHELETNPYLSRIL
ncbi:MBL fold metallo-hydrolase [Coriobacteriales bacterium OH1046]|nr:MBL fold metallo-hydrolase [Coriobacteriales bacterium OH1046]